MAPEVLAHKNHDISVDYYAMGIIIYELMFGRRPYSGVAREDVKSQIFSQEI